MPVKQHGESQCSYDDHYGLLALDPVESGREVEDVHERRGDPLIVCHDGSPLLEPGPEPLHLVPVVVDPVWAGDGCLVALGGDRWAGTARPDALAQGTAGIAPDAHHPLRHARQAVEERDGMGKFLSLTGSRNEGHRSPKTVGDHTGLGARARTRSLKRLT